MARLMRRSDDRILTTHAGSLARPTDLIALIQAKEKGAPYDGAAFAARSRESVLDVVRRQAAAGIDVVGDGEQSKSSFRGYINGRVTGFEDLTVEGGPAEYDRSREWQAFPEFYEEVEFAHRAPRRLTCTGPMTYVGRAELDADIENLRTAAAAAGRAEAFMTAVSPAYGAASSPNAHYPTQEEYELAWADAVREEYLAIVEAGLVLQIDDPRWITYYTLHPELTVAQWRSWAARQVELINHALRDVPADRVRFHTCYSINIGPRIHELDLRDIVDLMLRIDASAYNFEAANPRHEHEYHVWEDVALPDGKVLVPGVISHTTNIVEHPELVAERIVRFAKIVGRENVIAGADCGFSTNAREQYEIHPTVVWPKLSALAEGARLASAQLWASAG